MRWGLKLLLMDEGRIPGAAPESRRDRLKQLRAFCEAVRAGSLSGAARAMDASQAVVSGHVRALEAELGAALFRRAGAGLAPTRIGERLHHVALPLVEGLERLPELFEEHHTGVAGEALRIGAGEVSGGSVLPALVRRFQARWPRTRIEVRSGTGAERLAWLRGFELDLVVAAVGPVPGDIAFHPLVHADAVLVTPKGHPLGRCKRVDIETLGGQRLIAQPAGRHVRRIQDLVFALHGVRPRVVLEVEEWGSTLNHVAAGVGVAIVPDVCVSAEEPVCAVAIEHRFRLRTYGVAMRSDSLVSLAARRFVECAVEDPQAPDEAR